MAENGVNLGDQDAVRASVSKYYGETLQQSSDLKTSACCTAKAPPKEVVEVLRQLPDEIISKYYGCGSPFPLGLKGSGLRVLDLGCGSGRDCYVCAALVGKQGFVTGIDMTPAQLEVAERHSTSWQQHLGYAQPNMKFVKGAIEQLAAAGLEAGSIDLVISNCVINLSPDKAAVLQEAYRVLADGGEVYFSDVYCNRRLPADVRTHEVLLGECLGGALAVNDFVRLATQVGFTDPRVLEVEPIAVHDAELKSLLGDAAFYSITFRLFKLPGKLESLPEEDYGQVVTYRGSLLGAPDAYVLDSANTFPTGVSVPVSGNTAAMCAASWLAPHFTVTGDRSVHKGQFSSSNSSSSAVNAHSIAALAASSSTKGGSSCCPPTPAAAPAAGGSGSSCCAPKPAAAPAADGSGSSCCASKPAAAPAAGGSGSSCCAPKSSCCPPKEVPAVTATGGSCCAPKPSASSCCAPAPAPAPVAASSSGGGCCAPKQASGSSCCPPAAAPVAAAAPATEDNTCLGSSTSGCGDAKAGPAAASAPATGTSGCCGGRKCC